MSTRTNALKADISASIVVFFVALPICLGIAMASGVPLMSGILSGVVGGVLVGLLSDSKVGVSGPAAGLVAIILSGVASLGSFESFLISVLIAGGLQIVLGVFKLGSLVYFIPNAVIKGMLAAIGIIIICKELPYAVGWAADVQGNENFFQFTGEISFSDLLHAFEFVSFGSIFISIISLFVLVIWDKYLLKKHFIFTYIQGPLFVIILSVFIHFLSKKGALPFTLNPGELVSIPSINGLYDLPSIFIPPDFSSFFKKETISIGFFLALIASVETLLCVEATDKLDPLRRMTNPNRELIAQGAGNIVAGLVGALPITQVIIRSSANIEFGAKTKLSAILHGFWLLLAVVFLADMLNMIPLASLAVVLMRIGYKLAEPSAFTEMYKKGKEHFVPFMATVMGVVFFDLLIGVALGVLVSMFYLLNNDYKNPFTIVIGDDDKFHIEMAEQVTFLNKASVKNLLAKMPENASVIIDLSRSKYIHQDVLESIEDFRLQANSKKIDLIVVGDDLHLNKKLA
ncbi:SulP family inorganic anion transporter [Schleiferia thermophila]|jgi:SulP family sulfate permease|uniref:SulP family sulfate permease n=1 Tax=Schleiferia thermophila TaxID=884107 RepID=A0A369A8P0_9FLAO|nr:SulP family inorganic anion transporter [Schleiferia thermophila]PMB29635.1 SulP family inorganic anion transporter [Fischerella thermalis CCMEE 5319]RCX04788.1 SulP family sulfate permease [Schleiferia thermophila]